MAKQPAKPRGLGRGLSALMADVQVEQTAPAAAARPDNIVPIDKISPNADQPRRHFDETALEELAASIREKGVIQPLIVRELPKGSGTYQIVAGERRWRAAQKAQLHTLPVLIRDFDDTEVLEIAIIENIQRADLNPIDEAAGYRQLMDRFGHTQEQLSQALGKSRSHIANLMRLLNLPDVVQTWLEQGKLTAGHARALVGHDNATDLARRIIDKQLSVREAESLAKSQSGEAAGKTSAKKSAPVKDADTVQIENELTAQLKMRVSIDHQSGGDGGKVTISYKSLEQLDDLLRVLSDS